MYLTRWLSLTFLYLVSFSGYADVIKKSTSDICHDQSSRYYEKTKKFVSYSTISSCLDSGGRLSKSSTKHSNSALNDASKKYSRVAFGHGWADENKNCRNSRMEALIEHSLINVQYKTTKQCNVSSGRWISPFSGKTIYQASAIDIDHVVPLHWAWKRGASTWTKKQRVEFANDGANLLAVEASLNRQKGDKAPNKWLPPTNQCQYILRFTRVYKSYQLSPTAHEEQYFQQLKQQLCSYSSR